MSDRILKQPRHKSKPQIERSSSMSKFYTGKSRSFSCALNQLDVADVALDLILSKSSHCLNIRVPTTSESALAPPSEMEDELAAHFHHFGTLDTTTMSDCLPSTSTISTLDAPTPGSAVGLVQKPTTTRRITPPFAPRAASYTAGDSLAVALALGKSSWRNEAGATPPPLDATPLLPVSTWPVSALTASPSPPSHVPGDDDDGSHHGAPRRVIHPPPSPNQSRPPIHPTGRSPLARGAIRSATLDHWQQDDAMDGESSSPFALPPNVRGGFRRH